MTDAPRYRLVGYDIGTAPDENGGWVHWTDHEAIVARLTAERDAAILAKDCFQRMTRAHWEALCAMRNSINEYIPMPNTDSGPLFSPEDGPIYADIAERVIADLAESRAYALALEQELHDRAEKAEAERDAAMAWAVKVKPLVWEKLGDRAWRAPSPFFGSFRVECYGGGPWQALWSVPGFCDTFVDGDFAGPDDAKQAIDARICAAIQPDPEAHQAALAKAFCMGRDMAAETADNCRRSALAGMGMGPVLDAIRALLPPADATAALAARDAAMIARGMREAATLLREQGYGTAPKQILARAAEIEKESGA